ncbi:MAG: hypothetical protein CME58_04840 [Halieaceae bacterium]|nr:hypothetical protein [Halieaceae bacterium]|tara:strand:+ start:3386 stop:4072 length:687 start_codon:yes stop_codon:yes gene_type:complete
MKRFIKRVLICVALLVAWLLWLGWFSPRPPLMTDPVALAGDGSALNYCELPALNGTGLRAADIPKGNTPGCGYDYFPLPILAACTEPLPAEADDIRGLWRGVSGGHVGHVERIEQCGSRVVVTTSGLIHDYGPNSTGGLNTNDTEGSVLFTFRGEEHCLRTSASMIWEDKTLNFYAFGWGPRVVRRYRDGDELIWEYVDGSVTRMERLCRLPAEHKVPQPRGRRIELF